MKYVIRRSGIIISIHEVTGYRYKYDIAGISQRDASQIEHDQNSYSTPESLGERYTKSDTSATEKMCTP